MYCHRIRKPQRNLSVEYHGSPSRPILRPDWRRMSLYLEPGASNTTWSNDASKYHPQCYPPNVEQRRFSGNLPPSYRMTDSLTEIQGDIQRLSSQQQQIQSLGDRLAEMRSALDVARE